MKIMVFKPSRFLRRILRILFRVRKGEDFTT